MPDDRVVHVIFTGRARRRLTELQVYLGHVRELNGPETVSHTVRAAVEYLWKRFDRAARRPAPDQEAG